MQGNAWGLNKPLGFRVRHKTGNVVNKKHCRGEGGMLACKRFRRGSILGIQKFNFSFSILF